MSCTPLTIKKIKQCLPVALFFFQSFFISPFNSFSQSKWVLENYNYFGQPGPGAVVPMIHFETKKNWYAELRYNYEEDKTISFFAGKCFKGGNSFEYSLTPLAGFSAGNFTGVSAGINADAEWKNFYFSSQTQYSAGTKKGMSNFFFTWSEMGYNISNHFFGGIALQYTGTAAGNNMEPGFVGGFSFNDFSFPVYVFSPFHDNGYFVVGVNYEYSLKKKKKSGL